MANGNAAGDSSGNTSSNNKLATAVSSSSSTVSTSSSAAAAAASEASSSSTSLPSLPSLSTATTNTGLAVSFAHVTTLLPVSVPPASASASAAAIAAVDAAQGGLVVARPASVSLHDLSTLEATSTSDSSSAPDAGSVKCALHLHSGGAVTGHQDGRLRLWRASTRIPALLRLAAALPTVSDRLRRFPVPSNHVAVRRHHRRLWIEHADAVSGVAASADGRLLFSASWDRTLKVWALPSLRCLQSLPAHDDAVNAVAVAPDDTVYTGSVDRRVRVWAPRPASAHGSRNKKRKPVYHLVATLSRHTAAVNALAIGCGGQALYSGGNDRCVVVWEREDSASHMIPIGALRGHRKAVLSIACAAGGLVVSGAADQTVRAWMRAADNGCRGYACVAVIDGHGTAVRSVAAAPMLPAKQKQRQGDGGDEEEEWRVCSASFDGEVRVWSLRVASGS
jgi:WD40 repeat protein